MLRSEDGGATWESLPTLPFEEGTPFVLGGQLLMFVQAKSHRHFQIASSSNGGRTWSPPHTVLEGPLWNISTSMLVRPDALYWAMDHDDGDRACGGKVMVRLDRAGSPWEPKSWSASNVVLAPDLPEILTRNLFPGSRGERRGLRWLEPNTVDVGGRIRVFTRCMLDRQATAHVTGVLDYDPARHQLSFTQLTPWPGGQCKFFILHDAARAMYWMLSNLVTNSQDLLGWGKRMEETRYHGSPGNERRWLFHHYSIDCLNWFPASCVARWADSVHRSFMYPSAVVDGEDLVVLSRTSRDSGDQHDADLCTIHRVRGFRDLAMDLHEGGLHS